MQAALQSWAAKCLGSLKCVALFVKHCHWSIFIHKSTVEICSSCRTSAALEVFDIYSWLLPSWITSLATRTSLVMWPHFKQSWFSKHWVQGNRLCWIYWLHHSRKLQMSTFNPLNNSWRLSQNPKAFFFIIIIIQMRGCFAFCLIIIDFFFPRAQDFQSHSFYSQFECWNKVPGEKRTSLGGLFGELH